MPRLEELILEYSLVSLVLRADNLLIGFIMGKKCNPKNYSSGKKVIPIVIQC